MQNPPFVLQDSVGSGMDNFVMGSTGYESPLFATVFSIKLL